MSQLVVKQQRERPEIGQKVQEGRQIDKNSNKKKGHPIILGQKVVNRARVVKTNCFAADEKNGKGGERKKALLKKKGKET